jgi:hypothetical protein
VTGPLTEGARVVVSVVGVVVGDEVAMDAGWVYIAAASGHLVAIPIHATGVSITTIPVGPPTGAELARLRDMAREGREMTSTGRMDQGSAGQPVGRPGEGGTVATTRALPADPDPGPLPEWELRLLQRQSMPESRIEDTCAVGDPDPTPDWPADAVYCAAISAAFRLAALVQRVRNLTASWEDCLSYRGEECAGLHRAAAELTEVLSTSDPEQPEADQ